MLRQFNRFLIVLVLVAIVLIFTLKNSDQATLRLGENLQITTYAGIIYLCMFALGCVAASVVALFFGFKGYLRERRLVSAEKSRQAFFDLFVKARSAMAAREWGRARVIWEQVLRREPDNVVARVELSTCLEHAGDLQEALRVLDSTRASSKANVEVLFRAAELNRRLGNNTGASDNLMFINQEEPNIRSLEEGRDLAEQMGRLEDAIEYQNQLDRLGYDSQTSTSVRTRLVYAQIVQGSPDETTLRTALESFVRRHSSFVPALEHLAKLEIAQGKIEEGAELLVKAAKNSRGDISKWSRVIDLWLNTATGNPQRRVERATAAARSSAQDTRGAERLRAELLLVATFIAVNRIEDASQVLDHLPALAEREGITLPDAVRRKEFIMKGLCLSRAGQLKDTAELWEELVKLSSPVQTTDPLFAPRPKEAPSPALAMR